MRGTGDLPLEPGDLLAVGLPPSARWLEIVREAWDADAAVLPLDDRLPGREAARLLEQARPTVLLDAEGVRRLDGLPADEDVALVVPTSGTGGEPKLVQFDRGAIDAAVAASALTLEVTQDDRWLCCLPSAHIGGLLVLMRGVLLDAPVSVHAAFDVTAFAREREATFTSIVPTMLVRLLDAGVDLSSYHAILVGGAHLSSPVRQRADRADAPVIETYGLTETCGGVIYDGVPLPGVEVRIDGHDGIEMRGPTLMIGYRFEPEATAGAFTPDGWLQTGDAGTIDAEGRLRVIGRLDDLINSGGEKIWPDEVESALGSHPKVAAVGVGGRPDPEWGQRVVAWVVPADRGDPPSLEELRDHVSERLPRHKAPRELVLVGELPRTVGGKLRRRSLVAGSE